MFFGIYIFITGLIGFLYAFPGGIWSVLFVAVIFASMSLGISFQLTSYLALSTYTPVRRSSPSFVFTTFWKLISDAAHSDNSKQNVERPPVVFGRSVDTAFQDFLDLVVADIISPWLPELAFTSRNLQQDIK